MTPQTKMNLIALMPSIMAGVIVSALWWHRRTAERRRLNRLHRQTRERR